MKKRVLLILSISFLLFSVHAQEKNQLNIVYIGNMGVLLSNGKQSVSIDAFHVYYHADYQYPSKELVNSLMKGTFKDYPAVEVAMFTHVHGDHYFKGYGAEFVQGNSNAFLMAAAQSCEEARETLEGKHEAQIREVPYDGSKLQLTKGEVCITAFRLDHASPQNHGAIQNIAYIVEMEDQKVLHVGDSEWDAVKSIFPKHKVLQEQIDIAVLPYWMLLYDDPVENVRKYIRPKHVIATHKPTDITRSEQDNFRKLFPVII